MRRATKLNNGNIMAGSHELRAEITSVLAEEVGILADVIFDEILDALGIDETRLSRVWAGKFVRLLDEKLPQDINQRQAMIRSIADMLIKLK